MYTDACVKNSWRKSPRDDSCHLSGTHTYADSVMIDGECPPCVCRSMLLFLCRNRAIDTPSILLHVDLASDWVVSIWAIVRPILIDVHLSIARLIPFAHETVHRAPSLELRLYLTKIAPIDPLPHKSLLGAPTAGAIWHGAPAGGGGLLAGKSKSLLREGTLS